MIRRSTALLALFAAAVAVLALSGGTALADPGKAKSDEQKLSKIDHIVVVYEENHSFDNLYGGWEGVNGRADAPASKITQVSQAGVPFTCLLQNDVNLTSPPQPADCVDAANGVTSHFPNALFSIENYIPKTARTCPPPGVFAPNGIKDPAGDPGGCTKDIVHRFYQEQYQLNDGRQNRYTTGSDAVGLTQGYYDTTQLPIYQYLHSKGHPDYAIADNFFQSAFGGSFLNHQWLVAAATPPWAGMPANQHAVVDSNGMPNGNPPSPGYGLYHPTGPVSDPAGTRLCPVGVDPNPGLACGDYAVNTIQPPYQPTSSNPLKLSPQLGPTIGDRLSGAGVSWAWYSGGWSNADGDFTKPGYTNGVGACSDPNSFPNPSWPYCPNKVFQFHHQPLNYYASFAPGTAGRDNLKDEVEFQQLVAASDKKCQLNSVSFIKPIGLENEHPGYTNVDRGSSHLVKLIKSIEASSCEKNTMIIVTYDEFGGQWDHVSPPGQGGAPGVHDIWGPGTRIPALVLAKDLKGKFVVDSTQYDTTSIDATIEQRYGLAPLSSRDAAVNSLSNVFGAKKAKDDG